MNSGEDPTFLNAVLSHLKVAALERFYSSLSSDRGTRCPHTDERCDESSSDSSEDYDYDYDELDDESTYIRRDSHCLKCVAEVDKMARQLIEEENNEKLKIKNEELKKEKKRLKKQRQKQKRKEKQTDEQPKQDSHVPVKVPEDDDEIDLNSAFLSRAVEKLAISKQTDTEKLNKATSVNKSNNKNSKREHPVTPLALEAFTCATDGKFVEAVEKYTEALKVSTEDFRLYVNRSLCFLQIQEYEKALQDAILCITYAPDYAKGYFRKGEAYLGLENIDMAEKAFEEVLKLEPACQEAANDLIFIRIKKLINMGYSKEQASFAVRNTRSINEAIQFIIDNPECGKTSLLETCENEDVFNSDTDEDLDSSTVDLSDASSMISSVALSSHKSTRDYNNSNHDPFTDISNPYRCCELYIGGISAVVHQNILKSYLEKYGTLVSIKMLRSSNSALVTYDNWKSAANAMKNLQKTVLLPNTPKIDVKYPAAQISKFVGNSISLNKWKSNDLGSKDKNVYSQTMPPPSPSSSVSSMKSTRSQSDQRSSKINPSQDPSNPTNCASLYVGNISSKLKEKNLLDNFSRYGKVVSVRIITSSNCAFINFDSGRSAGNAMRCLQNKSLLPGTPAVVIKYPSKAIGTSKSYPADKPVVCYHWRTTGSCNLGKSCPFPHTPDQKGIAMTHKSVLYRRQ